MLFEMSNRNLQKVRTKRISELSHVFNYFIIYIWNDTFFSRVLCLEIIPFLSFFLKTLCCDNSCVRTISESFLNSCIFDSDWNFLITFTLFAQLAVDDDARQQSFLFLASNFEVEKKNERRYICTKLDALSRRERYSGQLSENYTRLRV